MKIEKSASGKQVVKMSKSEWENMGRQAGWIKEAQPKTDDKFKLQLLSSQIRALGQEIDLLSNSLQPGSLTEIASWADKLMKQIEVIDVPTGQEPPATDTTNPFDAPAGKI